MFTVRLVNVLLLMFCDSVVAELAIYVCALEPATECVMPLMSFPVMVNAAVAVPAVLFIPISALELAAL